MPGVVRQGDTNNKGAPAESGVSSVVVNNKPIVVDGTPVSTHNPWYKRHRGKKTANGKTNVVAGNKPVNVVGNSDTCGHPRVNGSNNVIIG
jgi:uncharacterized Zn-binding protein involved in type VI secretion